MITQVIINVVVTSMHVWLVAAGFVLIYRNSRFFNFAHAGTYTIGAYAAHTFFMFHAETIPWRLAGDLVGVIAAILVGGLLELAVFRPMRRRGAESGTLLLASLGCLIILQSLVSLVYGDAVRSALPPGVSEHVYRLFGAYVTTVQIFLIASCLFLGPILLLFFDRTRSGLIVRASASDPDLARTAGLPVESATLMTFMIGSGLAGLGGVLWAQNTALSPMMGFDALLLGIVAALVGGIRHLGGALAGALVVGAILEIGRWLLPGEWNSAVLFIAVVLVVLIMPKGIAKGIVRSNRR